MTDSPEPPGQLPGGRDDQRDVAPGTDPAVPSPARMYNYMLGGKDHYAADRIAAEKALALVPHGRRIALSNRYFLARAVGLMAEQGIRQFLDLGTGIPVSPSVHEIARSKHPAARVVYVDNDPVVSAHNRALLATSDGVRAIDGDIRQPEAILVDPEVRALIDFAQPVGVLMVAVLHFITNEESPERIVRTFADRMTSGSFLALSHVTSDGSDPAAVAAIREVYAGATTPAVFRPAAQIRHFFDGFDLQPPGLIDVVDWFPYAHIFSPAPAVRVLGGLGRRR